MSKPEIDWDEIFESALDALQRPDGSGGDALHTMITQLRDNAYEAGRQDVLREGAARTAMLEQQAEWLDAAAKADGSVGSNIGKVVAEFVASAFASAADAYRATPKPSLEEPTSDASGELNDELSDPGRCDHGFPIGIHCAA